MAAYISIPRDLTRIKTKVFFGLTKRQLVCFGAAALIGIPAFFLMKRSGNTSLAVLGMIFLMLPLFFLAMYEKDGQPLEVVARHFIQAKFIRPKIRPYSTNNYYSALMRQNQAAGWYPVEFVRCISLPILISIQECLMNRESVPLRVSIQR